jgi:opacity protein-like surface antigen
MRFLSLLLFACACAVSQPISVGVKGGVPLTDFFSTVETGQINYTSVPNRYIIGVAGEIRLPFGLGVEVDALYRHLNYASNSGTTGVTTVISSSNTTGNAWEFPILAKYRFPAKIVRPYVDAGIAFDTLQGLTQTIRRTVAGNTTTTSSSSPAELQNNTTRGFVIGAGLDIHVILHIQPEIRYTRWGAKHFLDTNGSLQSNQNQAEFLVGITF